MSCLLRPTLLLALAVGWGGVADAQDHAATGPRLGAASNFGQGWQPHLLAGATALPVRLFRDAVYWSAVETGGELTFEGPRELYPDLLNEAGAGLILVVNNGHPDHDAGDTPASPEAIAAFARHAAETVRRFPAIVAVEVGNEMNSDRFVSGPGWDVDLQSRAASYAALLAATASAVHAVRPEVRILGGAAHSIPLAWFRALFDAGAAAEMDALVIHPYTVAPEQLARQIALLRSVLPEAGAMPISVTEFGTADAADAPAHLLKSYCQMALSGVAEAVWYPVNARGDDLAALLDGNAEATPAGRAYRLASDLFEGRPAVSLAPDPFTYGCRFGEDAAVLWGAPRGLRVNGVQVYDAQGDPVDPEKLALSPEHPLVLVSEGAPLRLGETFSLGPQRVFADSVDQFAYPGQPGGPFRWLVRSAGAEAEMELREGQEKGGVPWTPYLGTSLDGVARAGADWVLPSLPAGDPVEIVLRYEAAAEGRADALVLVAPAARSSDGVEVAVTLDGRVLHRARIKDKTRIALDGLALLPGSLLDVVVGPGGSAAGDVTRLRVTLQR